MDGNSCDEMHAHDGLLLKEVQQNLSHCSRPMVPHEDSRDESMMQHGFIFINKLCIIVLASDL